MPSSRSGHGRLAHAAMPGSGLEIFDEAGHFPHHTDPARFVQRRDRLHGALHAGPLQHQSEWRDRLRRGTRTARR